MANYIQLTENPTIFIEQNIWDLRELKTYDSPWIDSPYQERAALGLYCFENERGKCYVISLEELRLAKTSRAIQVPLEALAIKNVKDRQAAIIELIKQDNQPKGDTNMFTIYGKKFTTSTEALEDVIHYIITEEPETIDNPELKNLLEMVVKYGINNHIIQKIEVLFYDEIWPSHNIDTTAQRLAFDLADISGNYFDAYRPFRMVTPDADQLAQWAIAHPVN